MKDPSTADWGPCPPGELSRLVLWLKFARAFATLALVSALVTSATGLVVAGWLVFGPSATPSPPHGNMHKSNKKGEFLNPAPGPVGKRAAR